MSIYVYDKKNWNKKENVDYISESDKYVFAMANAEINPYTDIEDKTNFKKLISEVKNKEFVKTMIVVTSKVEEKNRNNIYINSKILNSKAIFLNGNIAYLPLRETCEKLGYKVYWNKTKRSATIKSGDYQLELFIDSQDQNSGYKTIVENNNTFVSSLFFVWSLKANLEIDENNNISIIKQLN